MKNNKLEHRVARILIKAASYIRQCGWQVEGMGVHGKPRCSMGAISSAYPKVEWDSELSSKMYSAINQELGDMSLTQFNSKYQSGEKVAQLFESVAAKLKNASVLVQENI